MAVLKANTTEQNMLKKGFSLAPGDHKWFEFFLEDGTYVTRTKMSHNGQDIGDDLISKMSHQCKVSSSFFKEFQPGLLELYRSHLSFNEAKQ